MSSRTKRILKLGENTKLHDEEKKNQAKIPQAEPDNGTNKPIETGTFFVDEHGVLIGPVCEDLSSTVSSNEILLNFSENEVFNAIQNLDNLDISQIIQHDDQNRDGNQDVQQTKDEGEPKLQKNTIEVDVVIENEIGTLRQDLLFNNDVQNDGPEEQINNIITLQNNIEKDVETEEDILSQELIYDDEVEEYEPEGLTKKTEPKP